MTEEKHPTRNFKEKNIPETGSSKINTITFGNCKRNIRNNHIQNLNRETYLRQDTWYFQSEKGQSKVKQIYLILLNPPHLYLNTLAA